MNNRRELNLDVVNVSLTHCVPPSGNFGMLSACGSYVQSWDHCREQFAVKFTETTKKFFFAHESGRGLAVASFILRFEDVLRLGRQEDFESSNFKMTNFSRLMLCCPGDFWLSCYYRRSLLTLLLRCGLNYDHQKDNFDDALFGSQHKENQYIRDTKQSVMRFMYGFTRFTGEAPAASGVTVIKHGWKEEFEGLDTNSLRARLVAPTPRSKECSFVGSESLWT